MIMISSYPEFLIPEEEDSFHSLSKGAFLLLIKWGNSCLWAKTLAATFPFGLTSTTGPDLQKPDTRRLIILASQYYYY